MVRDRSKSAKMLAAGGMCRLRHRHTDQLMMVPVGRYLDGCRRRYRNWRLAGQPALIRPPATISEIMLPAMHGGDQR